MGTCDNVGERNKKISSESKGNEIDKEETAMENNVKLEGDEDNLNIEQNNKENIDNNGETKDINNSKAIEVENFADGKARLTEYRITEESKILGQKLKDCRFTVKSYG